MAGFFLFAGESPTFAGLKTDLMSLTGEIQKRKTFGIVSHPDAGKTTLTEKLLLFGGAIQVAGAVKSNKIKKAATSDFMEIERQRGISVATSVMAFPVLRKSVLTPAGMLRWGLAALPEAHSGPAFATLAGLALYGAANPADLRSQLVTADELERAKKPRIEQLEKARETNGYWLSELSGAQRDPRRLDAIRALIPGTERVTPDDVKRAAEAVLKDESMWMFEVKPAKAGS